MENPSYYAVIPAEIRYDHTLKANEKLMYGEIVALSNKYGYCNASNNYFSNLYKVNKKTISGWISKLNNRNYIDVDLIRENKIVIERRIYLSIKSRIPYP